MPRLFTPLFAFLLGLAPSAASASTALPDTTLGRLRVAMVYTLRVVEAACPTGLGFTATRCYEHGYGSVFDFKEAFFDLDADLEPTELWTATTLVAGGDTGAAYRASFRTEGGQVVTLTFVEGLALGARGRERCALVEGPGRDYSGA